MNMHAFKIGLFKRIVGFTAARNALRKTTKFGGLLAASTSLIVGYKSLDSLKEIYFPQAKCAQTDIVAVCEVPAGYKLFSGGSKFIYKESDLQIEEGTTNVFQTPSKEFIFIHTDKYVDNSGEAPHLYKKKGRKTVLETSDLKSVCFRIERVGEKGLCLLANEDILVPDGQEVLVDLAYLGEILREEEREDDRTYFMQLYPRYGTSWSVDASKIGNPARFASHSCAPNSAFELKYIKTDQGIEAREILHVLKTILKGEEITFDYNLELYGRQNMTFCFCGVDECPDKLSLESLEAIKANLEDIGCDEDQIEDFEDEVKAIIVEEDLQRGAETEDFLQNISERIRVTCPKDKKAIKELENAHPNIKGLQICQCIKDACQVEPRVVKP